MIEKFEEAREDVLSQLKGFELEDKVEELHRQRDEASAAGRGSEAREYSKKIDKHNVRLKERGDRLEDLPAVTRIFAYGILTSFIFVIAFSILLAPLFNCQEFAFAGKVAETGFGGRHGRERELHSTYDQGEGYLLRLVFH